MKCKSGFTLMELMVVIAIIGITSAIVIPNLIGWLPNYRLGGSARDIFSTLQAAKQRAIKDNVNVVVLFDVANDTYTAFIDSVTSGTAWALDSGETVITSNALPPGVDLYQTTLSGGTHTTGFSPRGMILPPATGGEVYLSSAGNRYRGVDISITGNVKIINSNDGITWN